MVFPGLISSSFVFRAVLLGKELISLEQFFLALGLAVGYVIIFLEIMNELMMNILQSSSILVL